MLIKLYLTCLSVLTVLSKEVTIEEREGKIWRNSPNSNDASIRPFKIRFTKKMIADLKYRIKNRRDSSPPLKCVGFEYGFNSSIMPSWMDYWSNEYDFTARENYLNQFPQYKTNIQGLDVHFIWIKPKVTTKKVLPLLILHGFPGSVREFYGTIPHLTATNNGQPFNIELIAPSLPGFGFSDGATVPGCGGIEMAVVFKLLMQRLGHEEFYVQGGDWGAFIASMLATLYPERILGYHTNFAVALSPITLGIWIAGAFQPSLVVDKSVQDRRYPLVEIIKFTLLNSGYFHVQATKPDSLGVGMSDSPAGLLAWILHLFGISTGKPDGGLDLYPREELIDNIMMYWAPNSFTTAIRIYAEIANMRNLDEGLWWKPTPVPVWSTHTKLEIIYHSPVMLKPKYPNLINSTIYHEYGHFFAMEQPKIFAESVFTGLNAFEKWHSSKIKDEL